MNRARFPTHRLFAVVCVTMTAASGAAGAKETVLYRFQGGSDGAQPMAAMTADANGNLFGTTALGGSGPCNTQGITGCGTVFELSPPAPGASTWTESVLYAFQGGSDGAYPQAKLIADGEGNLIGSTFEGGTGNCGNEDMAGCGVVFELSPPSAPGNSWTRTILYSFQGNPAGKGNGDLAWPNGLVFGANGDLYGLAYKGGHCTTDETGTYCLGGAFKLKNTGGAPKETVLYRFKGPSGAPAGPVLDANGNLYGTAPGGAYGCGGVFMLQPPQTGRLWTEMPLYDFHCNGDGAFPLPGLAFDKAGNLYDVSIGTGSEPGNVFELSPSQSGWTETVVYDFAVVANGYIPTTGPIVADDGTLYGTTEEGGRRNFGALFALAPQNGGGWNEKVLHSFGGANDGRAPYGGLVFGKHNALYGTTPTGGSSGCGGGCGIVYRVAP